MASRRSLLLGAGLALTLMATWYAARLDDAADDLLASPQRAAPAALATVKGAAEGADTSVVSSTAHPSASPQMFEAQRMAREGGDLFPHQSWKPQLPPPPVAIKAPPPRAPELPYRYLGRMEEDGHVIAFLAEGAQLQPRVVREGDLLPNYRVDEITSTGMRLTYLPLNETQRLLFGSTP